MSDEVALAKRALRAQLRERRRITTVKERDAADAALTENLIALVRETGARSLTAYLNLPDEPPTRAFLAWALEQGVRVLLPRSRPDGLMDWVRYGDGGESVDDLGMPVPEGEILGPIAMNDVDLIIVPAASVDHTGMRLGWGRGYFDKTLGSMEARPPVYAVIYDHELVDAVPSERHDQRVDGVVTPSGVIAFES